MIFELTEERDNIPYHIAAKMMRRRLQTHLMNWIFVDLQQGIIRKQQYLLWTILTSYHITSYHITLQVIFELTVERDNIPYHIAAKMIRRRLQTHLMNWIFINLQQGIIRKQQYLLWTTLTSYHITSYHITLQVIFELTAERDNIPYHIAAKMIRRRLQTHLMNWIFTSCRHKLIKSYHINQHHISKQKRYYKWYLNLQQRETTYHII